MSIRVSWFNKERTAVLWSFEQNWGCDNFNETADHTERITRNNPMFDIVVDATQLTSLPPHAIVNLRNRYLHTPDNFGVGIVFGANSLVKATLSIAGKLPPVKERLIFVQTQHDARELVKERYRRFQDMLDAKTQNFAE